MGHGHDLQGLAGDGTGCQGRSGLSCVSWSCQEGGQKEKQVWQRSWGVTRLQWQSRERGEPASVAALENLARESRGEDTQRGVAR